MEFDQQKINRRKGNRYAKEEPLLTKENWEQYNDEG